MKKKIPFLIESENGHDEKLVPEDKVKEETIKQVKDGKWATLQKSDGSSEIVTEDDLDEEDKELMKEAKGWKDTFKKDKTTSVPSVTKTLAKKFERVTSVTATSKAKGG